MGGKEGEEEGMKGGGRERVRGRVGVERERERTSSEVAMATVASASDLCLEKFAPNTI